MVKERGMKTRLVFALTKFLLCLSDCFERWYCTSGNGQLLFRRGPNIQGIPPQEASERLTIFQTRFDDLWRKFGTYSGGEELFGLSKTEYPALHKIKKELNLLSKLYTLYNAVSCRKIAVYIKSTQAQPGGHTGPCPPQFVEHMVILYFERRYPKQNSFIRLKSDLLPPNVFGLPQVFGLARLLLVD